MMMTNSRRFLDRLPELADSLLMVKFTIIVTGNYRPFIRQCISNTINLSQSTLACVLKHRRHESNSGRATGRTSKNRYHHGARAKSRLAQAPGARLSDYKTLTQALAWNKIAHIYYRLIISFYLYHLFKNLLLDLISYDLNSSRWFTADFRFLDCLLLGRFRFVGRTNKISAAITNVFMLALLIYRAIIHTNVPKFKFYVLEFMMNSHAEVLKHEFKFPNYYYYKKRTVVGNDSSRTQQIPMAWRSHLSATPFDNNHLFSSEQLQVGTPTTRVKMPRINSIFFLRNPFDLQESDKWILRLNRTGKSWLALNACTKLLIYWSVFALCAWFALLYRALIGSILTNTGFEMSYPSCVAWLRDAQRSKATTRASNNYSHIYLAPEVLAHEIRLDDLPARFPLDTSDLPRANLYNFARIAFDIIENHLLYMEFIFIFIAQFYLLAISSIDITLNALALKARLVSLLEKLEANKRLALEHKLGRIWCYSKLTGPHRPAIQRHQPIGSFKSLTALAEKNLRVDKLETSSHTRHLSLPVTQTYELDDQLNECLTNEIADLQALLADHFDNITRGYNLFVAFMANFLLFIWLAYTVVICTWIGAVKSRAIEWEFLITESGGSVFALILLACVASVRSQNVQLYPLIARSMALDSACSPTKARWTLISGYFNPKPLYCFTLFGSTEVSLLLCLKLISWILSAFVLLANFYYMTRS